MKLYGHEERDVEKLKKKIYFKDLNRDIFKKIIGKAIVQRAYE